MLNLLMVGLVFGASVALASPNVPNVGSTVLLPTKEGYAFGTTTNGSIGKVQSVLSDGKLVIQWDTPLESPNPVREVAPEVVDRSQVLAEIVNEPVFRSGKQVILDVSGIVFLGTLERTFEKGYHEIRWQTGMWWWGETSTIDEGYLFVQDEVEASVYKVGTRLQRRWWPNDWGTVVATYSGPNGSVVKVVWAEQARYGTDADYIPLQTFDCVYMNRRELCGTESSFKRKSL